MSPAEKLAKEMQRSPRAAFGEENKNANSPNSSVIIEIIDSESVWHVIRIGDPWVCDDFYTHVRNIPGAFVDGLGI